MQVHPRTQFGAIPVPPFVAELGPPPSELELRSTPEPAQRTDSR